MEIDTKSISKTHIDSIVDYCMELFFSYVQTDNNLDYNKIEDVTRRNVVYLLNNKVIKFSQIIYSDTGFEIPEEAIGNLESFATQFIRLFLKKKQKDKTLPEKRYEVGKLEFYFLKSGKEFYKFRKLGLKESNLAELVRIVVNFMLNYGIDIFENDKIAVSQIEICRNLSLSPTIMSRLSGVVVIYNPQTDEKCRLNELILSVKQILKKRIRKIYKNNTPGKIKILLDNQKPIFKLVQGNLREVSIPSVQYIKNLLKEIKNEKAGSNFNVGI